MPNTLSDKDWEILLRRIEDGKCTPILGAGVNKGILPLGRDVAEKWAEQYNYPLEDCSDLARTAQFLAITRDKMFPKEEILKWFDKLTPTDLATSNEPLAVLADLPLPVYITTNYNDFMVRALISRHKDPRRELCRWNSLLKARPSVFNAPSGFRPTVANPVVFHLHGHNEAPESLVLTEDDYLDFLVNISRDQDLLPPRIQEALSGASLLFVGYGLAGSMQ